MSKHEVTELVNATWIEFSGWSGSKMLVKALFLCLVHGKALVVVPKNPEIKIVEDFGVQHE